MFEVLGFEGVAVVLVWWISRGWVIGVYRQGRRRGERKEKEKGGETEGEREAQRNDEMDRVREKHGEGGRIKRAEGAERKKRERERK